MFLVLKEWVFIGVVSEFSKEWVFIGVVSDYRFSMVFFKWCFFNSGFDWGAFQVLVLLMVAVFVLVVLPLAECA